MNQDALAIGSLWGMLILIGGLLIWGSIAQLDAGEAPSVKVGGAIFTALLWAFGCLVVGSFLGFLFGVPRIVQNAEPAAAPGAPKRRLPAVTYQANTALEDVADWLTKMVVGVSLVQLTKAPQFLVAASKMMSASYGNAAQSQAFGIAVIVYFSFVGFLGSYLMTKLYLQQALQRSDSSTLGTAPEKANLTVEEVIALKNATIGFSERERTLSGLAAVAAGKLLDEVTLEELESAQDYVLWAKAQMNAGEFAQAIVAYQKAIPKAPADVTIKAEYATALYLQERQRRRNDDKGQPADRTVSDDEKKKRREAAHDMREQLVEAYRGLWSGISSDQRRDVFKNLTYVYLYPDESPNDFEDSIRYGEEYLFDPRHLPSGGLCVNLACAYGQKAAWLRQQLTAAGKTEPEKAQYQRLAQDVRLRALANIKEAMRLSSTWKARFRELLQTDGTGRHRDDNDLQIFESDPEFRKELDLPPLTTENAAGDEEQMPDHPVPPERPAAPLPAIPTGAALARQPDGSVIAKWDAVAGAQSYRPSRKIEGADPDFVDLDATAETQIALPGLPEAGALKFRVRATNATGESAQSEVVELALG